MQKNNTKTLIIQILKPSAVGMVVYICFALAVLVTVTFPSVQHYLGLTQSLNPGGFLLNGLYNFTSRIFGSSVANNLADFVFWLLVGFVVYIFFNTLSGFISETNDVIKSREFITPISSISENVVKHYFRRIIYHLVLTIILVAYIFYVVIHLVSLSATHLHPSLAHNYWIETIILLFLQCLSLHGAVILTRLLLGRSRLMGYNWEEV